jgi:lysophospholipase L1-like esterase
MKLEINMSLHIAFRLFTRICITVLLIMFSIIPLSKPTFAQQDCTEEKLRNLGVAVVNCAGSNRCIAPSANTPTSSPAAGSSIYVVGDSLTYGMIASGQLLNKINAAGYITDINFTNTGTTGSPPNQVSGPSVIAQGGKDIAWGNDRITDNSAAVAASDVVIVGLGTNNIGNVVRNDGGGALPSALEDFTNEVRGMVANIRAQNPDITIYWTNIYITGILTTDFGTFNMDVAMPIMNQAIDTVAAESNVSVIPWGSSEQASALVSSDGIHPSGNYPQMADYIVGYVSGGTGLAPNAASGLAGCACSQSKSIVLERSEEERYQSTWNYLVGNIGVSEEAAAGVMGNLQVESAGTMDPQVVEFRANFPGDRSPEIPLEFVSSNGQVFRGNFGYGIVQWTSAGRQDGLVALAAATNRSTGSLDLQLDFLFEELRGDYRSALAVLETPEVSIEEASDAILLIYERPAKVLPPPRGTAETRAAEIENRRNRSRTIYEAYKGSGGVYSAATCAGSQNGNVTIDLDAEDTSNITCAPGTAVRDDSIAAYSRGQQFIIKTCDYGGYTVNSQLSGSLKGLVDQAVVDNVPLSANNSFRSMDEQIGVYNNWCSVAGVTPTPPPYPKSSRGDYAECPGGAPPGYSNHQMGFAIDFNCNGTLIPQEYSSAQTNQCFQWLQQNAEKYGLYELGHGENRDSSGYEGWHWSVDGT